MAASLDAKIIPREAWPKGAWTVFLSSLALRAALHAVQTAQRPNSVCTTKLLVRRQSLLPSPTSGSPQKPLAAVLTLLGRTGGSTRAAAGPWPRAGTGSGGGGQASFGLSRLWWSGLCLGDGGSSGVSSSAASERTVNVDAPKSDSLPTVAISVSLRSSRLSCTDPAPLVDSICPFAAYPEDGAANMAHPSCA